MAAAPAGGEGEEAAPSAMGGADPLLDVAAEVVEEAAAAVADASTGAVAAVTGASVSAVTAATGADAAAAAAGAVRESGLKKG